MKAKPKTNKRIPKTKPNQSKPNPNVKISLNKHHLISFTKTALRQAFYTSSCHESSYYQRHSREVITLNNSLPLLVLHPDTDVH